MTDTDEVREAAKRLRQPVFRLVLSCPSIVGWSDEDWSALRAIANAYLAEHPADDHLGDGNG